MSTKLLYALLFSVLLVCKGWPNYDVKLSNVSFDGGFVLFPVKRAKLQQRLDEINCQFDNDDVKLFLPSEPILQDVIANDEHVVMIGFGTTEALAFNDALSNKEKKTESTLAEGLGIEIPYLTSKNGGMEKITLQMELFTSGGKHPIQANVVLPDPIVADRFVRERNGNAFDILFEKDKLHIHLIGVHDEPCESRGHHVVEIEDVQEYERELQISRSGPDFSICSRLPELLVDPCDVYMDPQYNPVLKQAGNNVCQYWVPTDDVQNCKGTFHITSISQQMRELLLLDEDEDVLRATVQSGTFDIRVLFPCME